MIRKVFNDDVFKENIITHERETVRVIACFKDLYAFLEVDRNDIFGCCRHLETLGGGIEANESHEQAIQREIREESGFDCEIIRPLCIVEDVYHVLGRKTISYFYAVRLIGEQKSLAYTEDERKLIKGLVFLKKEEVLSQLSSPDIHSIQKLIYQRDLFAYQCYLETC